MTPEEAKHQLKAAKEAGTRPRPNPYPLGSEAAEQWQRGWETCLRGRQGPGFNPRNMNRYRVEGFKACLDSAPVDHMHIHQGRSEEWEEGYCQGFLDVTSPRQQGRPSQYGKGRDWNFGYANGRGRGQRIAESRQSMVDYHSRFDELFDDNKHMYDAMPHWNCRSTVKTAQPPMVGCPTCNGGRNPPPDAWGCSDCQNTGEMPDFETADQKEQAMDSQEAITLIQLTGGASIVKCVYMNNTMNASNEYHFKNVVGLELEVDDIVVVESRDTYALVKVVATEVMPDELSCSFSALKHVVQKVDLSALTAVHKQERQAKYKLGMSTVTSRLDKYREQLGQEGFGDLRGLLAAPTTVRPVKSTMQYGGTRTGRFEQAGGAADEDWQAVDMGDTIEGSVDLQDVEDRQDD